MSGSAPDTTLVVGGSAAERECWTGMLADVDGADAGAVADGAAALDRFAPDVEALLVHRELPERTAPALVSTARERGFAFRTALLTPEAPTADIVALGFDAWLLTPVDSELLARTAEGLLACRDYDRAISALYEVASEGADGGTDAAREQVEAARERADAALQAIETIDRRALLANNHSVVEGE
jgi:hypothetical protein